MNLFSGNTADSAFLFNLTVMVVIARKGFSPDVAIYPTR